jgi:hypothetical protein
LDVERCIIFSPRVKVSGIAKINKVPITAAQKINLEL